MRVAVLYNQPRVCSKRDKKEFIVEHEVIEIAEAIAKGLDGLGYEAIPMRCSATAIPALRRCDAVFNLAEGFEDNMRAEPYVAGVLELLTLPYTGSPPEVLEMCRNKYHAKLLMEREGIPTPSFQLFGKIEGSFNLDFPVIVKPVLEDASIGITPDSVARNEEELWANVQRVLGTYHQPALVEEYIEGREINVAVLGNGAEAQILPLSEIVFNLPIDIPRIVTFEAKWVEESLYYKNTMPICPAEIEPSLEEKIKMLTLRVYSVLGMRDYTRVDFRIRGNDVFVLEANPNPCINPQSSGFVRSAIAAGLSYPQVIERILSFALERGRRHEVRDKTRDKTNVDSFAYDDLIFRRIRASDTPLLLKWFEDTETARFMEPSSADSEDQSLIKILTSVDEDFLIYLNTTAIGFASIYNLKECTGEVSYMIGEKNFRGRGIGKKIANAIVEYGFTKLGLSSLFASSTVENIPSIKALESAGFKRIGIRRAYQRLGNECLDEVLLDITMEDFINCGSH